MALHESGEDYLEAILVIRTAERKLSVPLTLRTNCHFPKPSVSVAMKNLKANNYITVDGNGSINLTETGLEIANKIYERHTFLTKLADRHRCQSCYSSR